MAGSLSFRPFRFGVLGHQFEASHRVAPHLGEVGLDGGDALVVQLVDAAGPIAQPLTSSAFRAEEICAAVPTDKRLDDSENARAQVDNGRDSWSVQQQTFHYPGDSWTIAQLFPPLCTARRC